jgi:hypothetical protein
MSVLVFTIVAMIILCLVTLLWGSSWCSVIVVSALGSWLFEMEVFYMSICPYCQVCAWVVYPCPSLMFLFRSTRCIMTGHLAVFALFMKEDTSQCVYLGLLHIDDGKKDIEMVLKP